MDIVDIAGMALLQYLHGIADMANALNVRKFGIAADGNHRHRIRRCDQRASRLPVTRTVLTDIAIVNTSVVCKCKHRLTCGR